MIILAAQLHNSAYLFLFIIAAFFVLEHSERFSSLMKFVITIAFIIAIVFAGQIFEIASSISGFHYNNYGNNTFSGSGLMVFVLYVPMFFILYKMMKHCNDERIRNLTYILAISSCLFNLLSYRFRVIERMEFYILALYMIVIPFFFCHSNIIDYNKDNREKNIYLILYILYLLFRGYMVFTSRVTVASGMAQYSFFNPF